MPRQIRRSRQHLLDRLPYIAQRTDGPDFLRSPSKSATSARSVSERCQIRSARCAIAMGALVRFRACWCAAATASSAIRACHREGASYRHRRDC